MADCQGVFSWPPPVFYDMPLTEVLEWRHRALLRSGAGDDE
ncbi:GpE family phage tail protein [Pantoea sp. MQR6]